MDLTLCLSEHGGAWGKAAAHPVIDSCWSDSNHGRESLLPGATRASRIHACSCHGNPRVLPLCLQMATLHSRSAGMRRREVRQGSMEAGGGGRWDEMSSWYWHLEKSREWVRPPPVCTVQPPRLHLAPPVGAAIPFQLHASQVEAQHSLKASVRLSACQSLCCCASILHSYTAPQSHVCSFNHICGELTKSSACCMKVTHKKCIFNHEKTVYMV